MRFPRQRTSWPRFLAVGLLVLSFGLALTSAVQKSPTMDEQNHIARGAAYLGTGDPRLSVEHPPLVNVLSALPAHLLLDLRLPITWLGLVLVSLVFRWAAARFGPWGGLLAAAFCALDPNLLAHTRLSTTDVGGACLAFLAAYALWRALQRPSWLRVLGSGVAFGLALGAKLSNLLFAPLFALALLVGALVGGRGWLTRAVRNLALLALVVLLGLLVVWGSYGFRVGPVEENGPLVPAPPYLKGIRAILDFSTAGRPAYLWGQYSHQGWWYYFPVAFMVKTPLPTLAALLVATCLTLRRPRRDDVLLLIPPLAYFGVSMTSNLNIGYRHLLPMLPFLAVHIARLTQLPLHHSTSSTHLQRIVPLALAAWLTINTLTIHPHFLAFFNSVGGGPEEGWRILVDSNIDWGQDLKGLRDWMKREGVERVRLGLSLIHI